MSGTRSYRRMLLCAAGAALALGGAAARAGTESNLVFNGAFELRDPATGLPKGWDTERPGNVRLADGGAGRGRVVEMQGDTELMASYGVALRGGRIPVTANTRYRCTGLTRSEGPAMKVFVKGYGAVSRVENGVTNVADEAVYQMRKDIDPTAAWTPFQLDFELLPAEVFSDFQHRVDYLRITLWAFWPVGRCWFDDIRFVEVGPVPGERRRHAGAVTHTGKAPQLGPAAGAAPAVSEETLWQTAVNAWGAEAHADALALAGALIARNGAKADYRLLAARAARALERWDEALEQAAWLLAPDNTAVRDWQRDWATVVAADAWRHRGEAARAREMLQALLSGEGSPHAREAARELRDAMDAE
ncbi:MAG: hypothetical protein JW951_02865 [Lentisphaerae bacterium]|nr:hypothetical protein [Lentisphaerota bacterium]